MAPLQTYKDRWWAKSGDGTTHEFGHTLLRSNLPEDQAFLPKGEAPSEVTDEAMARLYQNFIYRSESFWEFFGPIADKEFGIENDPEEVYRSFKAIDPENTERVVADQITYPLHVALRYEIERDLLNGEMEVEEVPEVWDEKLHEYIGQHFGMTREEIEELPDTKKALADVHWGKGKFGYFPTYSQGDALAAELYEEMDQKLEKDVEDYVKEGELGPINEWLEENIHRYGKAYDQKLKEKELGPEPLLNWMRETAENLYGN